MHPAAAAAGNLDVTSLVFEVVKEVNGQHRAIDLI